MRLQNDPKMAIPSHLVAKPPVPASKHHTYYELRDNKDKKKRLDFKVQHAAFVRETGSYTTIGYYQQDATAWL